MLVVILDVAALWLIATFLSGQSMADDRNRFLLLAGVLLVVSVGVTLSDVPAELAFAVWFGTLLLGMKYLIGASWLGSFIGGTPLSRVQGAARGDPLRSRADPPPPLRSLPLLCP